MWHIQNPIKVFSNFCKLDNQNKFSVFVILEEKKYNFFPKEDIAELEKHKNIEVEDIKIKDPNNPAKTINAKLISLFL